MAPDEAESPSVVLFGYDCEYYCPPLWGRHSTDMLVHT